MACAHHCGIPIDNEVIFLQLSNNVGVIQPRKLTKFAHLLSAMGTEARLQIMQLLLKAHPKALVVTEILAELGIPGSTLHHLDKLRNEGLVHVRWESTFLR